MVSYDLSIRDIMYYCNRVFKTSESTADLKTAVPCSSRLFIAL
jgi:hypothetical protein